MWKRQIIEELEQSGKFRKVQHFTVMQSLKPGKDNTYVISRYDDIQNLRRYLVSYHDINIISIYCPALVQDMAYLSEENDVSIKELIHGVTQSVKLPMSSLCDSYRIYRSRTSVTNHLSIFLRKVKAFFTLWAV